MLLTLVRHGECLGQCDQNYASDPDSPLSSYGIAQAQAAGQQLATEAVTHIITSPLLRALATADSVATTCAISHIAVWPELREGFSGSYNGNARSKLQAQFSRALLADDITEEGWTHGDADLAAFWQRCQQAVIRIREQFTHHDTVVVVTHGGFANYMLHILLGIPRAQPQWFELDNGSLTRIRLVPDPAAERPNWPLYPPIPVEIKNINDVKHLAAVTKRSTSTA